MAHDDTGATFYLIPHTHWEGAVFQTREAYLDMGLPNILRALALLKAYPDYRFTLDQACYIKPFLERYPEEVQAFRRFVEEGRLAIVGGTDTMLDVNMPGGESFVRQVLYGKGYLRATLGVDVTVGWQLDTFGHHCPDAPTAQAGGPAFLLVLPRRPRLGEPRRVSVGRPRRNPPAVLLAATGLRHQLRLTGDAARVQPLHGESLRRARAFLPRSSAPGARRRRCVRSRGAPPGTGGRAQPPRATPRCASALPHPQSTRPRWASARARRCGPANSTRSSRASIAAASSSSSRRAASKACSPPPRSSASCYSRAACPPPTTTSGKPGSACFSTRPMISCRA